MSTPTVSLSEASRRAGISTTQLRRWIEAGKLPGTVRSSTGSYQIPVAELIEALPAGSWDSVKKPSATPDAPVTVTPDAPVTVTPGEAVLTERLANAERTIEELRERLEQEQKRRDDERALADQMVIKLSDALSTLMRALPSVVVASESDEATPKRKRRRWRKRDK